MKNVMDFDSIQGNYFKAISLEEAYKTVDEMFLFLCRLLRQKLPEEEFWFQFSYMGIPLRMDGNTTLHEVQEKFRQRQVLIQCKNWDGSPMDPGEARLAYKKSLQEDQLEE